MRSYLASFIILSICFAFPICKPINAGQNKNENLQNAFLNSADTFIKNTIDTALYTALPFYDSDMYHEGLKGYQDTFTINHFKFRIIHNDSLFDGVVEKFENGHWYKTMQFANLGNHNDYDISKDFDGDGFNDLIFYWKWSGEIHFFDSASNAFSDTVNCIVDNSWVLLDTAQLIYYENDFGKMMTHPVYSNLFTFHQKKRIDMASFEINFKPGDDDKNFLKSKLFLNGREKPIEIFNPDHKESIADFDFENFWKTRYKKYFSHI